MEKLQALFRALLGERRTALLAYRARASEGGGGDEAWAAILKEAHTLKGSGGQFGFPEITGAARALRNAAEEEREAAFDALLRVIDGVIDGGSAADSVREASGPGPLPSDATAPDAREAKALLVEDDPLIAAVVCNTLRQSGCAVTHCPLGADALALLQAGGPRFDFVLLDISMPGISGLEVLRRVRAAPATADLPVMMVSAHAEASTITYARTLGADAYLTKPFSPERLLRHVRALLDAQRQADAPAGRP